MKLPDMLRRELETIPGRWTMDEGARHHHIRVDGRLVGVIPKGAAREDRRAQMNIRSNIRKIVEGRA